MKTSTSKKTLGRKRNKDEGLLTSVAESIGSTIGTIVGSANATQNAMTRNDGKRSVERQEKRLVRKSKISRNRAEIKR
jgi:hypothetical protein